MGEGGACRVGDDLFDDRVSAVLGLGLQHRVRAGGEHGVVPPGVEQSGWAFDRVEPFDPAHDQARARQPCQLAGQRGVADFDVLGVGVELAGVGVD